MFLVVEGQRATGKTAAIAKMKDFIPIKAVKDTRGSFVTQQIEKLFRIAETHIRLFPAVPFVLDRFYLTEYVMRKSEAVNPQFYDQGMYFRVHEWTNRLHQLGGITAVLKCNEFVRQERIAAQLKGDEVSHKTVHRLWAEAADEWADLVIDTTYIQPSNVAYLLASAVLDQRKGRDV